MNNQATPKSLKPKLRFPEFRSGWESELMSALYTFQRTNSLSRDKLNYENGSVKNIHYGDIHTRFATLFDITKENVPYINPSEPLDAFETEDYCVEGDMVFADASEDLQDVGKSIEIVRLNNERVLSGTHTILARQVDANLLVGFGGYLFKSGKVRTQIQKEAQGAKVFGISAGRLGNIEIPFPKDKAEQRKIAECLTSLDEVIAGHGQKLAALQSQKKGLLQQLVPSPGETRPRLRFPEFQHAGEWNELTLSNACRMKAGQFVAASDIKEQPAEGLYPCYGGNGLRGYVPTFTHEGTYSLIGRQGALCGNVKLCTGRFHATEHAVVATPEKGIDVGWLYYALDLLNLNRFATGQAQPGLSVDNLEKVALTIPEQEGEQHRIAMCLSSLDDLIAAQTQKLEVLKTHKQGLMQQLFPATAEAADL